MRRVLSNAAASVAGKVIGLAIQLVLIALLVRTFGAETYGLLVLALGLVGNSNLLEGGFGRYATKEVAECLVRGDRAGVAEVVSVNLLLAIGQGVGFALLFLIIDHFWLEAIFSIPPDLVRSAHHVVRAFIAVMVLDLLVISLLRIGEGFQDHVRTKAIEVGKQLLRVLLVAAVVAAGGTIEAVAAAYATASLLAFALAAWWLARLGELPVGVGPIPWDRMLAVGRFSAIITVQKVSGFVANRADVFIVGHVLGPAGLTVYQIAFKFYEVFGEFVSTLTYAFMPHVAELSARGEEAQIGRLFVRSSKYVLMLSVPAMCVTALTSGWLVEAWVGPIGRTATGPALAYLASVVFLSLPGAGPNILLGLGRLRELVGCSIVGALVSVTGTLVLVDRLGVLGAALGTLAGSAITGVAIHVVCSRRLVEDHWAFTRRIVGRYAGPAFAAFGASAAAAGAGLAAGAGAALLVVAVAVAWWLETESRDDVRRIVSALRLGSGDRSVRVAN